MRLVLAIAFSLAFVPASMTGTAVAQPAQQPPQPATSAAEPTTPATPPVRFDWQGNHKKAQAALNAKDYKTAIKLFTDVINSGRLPKDWVATTFLLRGQAYRGTGQHSEAVADFQKAVDVDPKLYMAHYLMGTSYQGLNQHGKAIDAFSKAIALKGDNAGYFYARCISEITVNRMADATRDCRAASKLRPGDANMLATLGRLLEDQGQKEEAMQVYRAALAINPNQPEAKEGLAFLEKPAAKPRGR